MKTKIFLATTILVLFIGGCANSQTKIQANIPLAKITKICVQKDVAGFDICPEGNPQEGTEVWVSHKIPF